MELYAAHRQWAERPNDERFWTPDEMKAACKEYADRTTTVDVKLEDLDISVSGDDEIVVGKDHEWSRLTNWAFGQIASYAKAPPAYLRTLPAPMACDCLRYGWEQAQKSAEAIGAERPPQRLLVHARPDGKLIHAVTSTRYTRIWNWEIADKLIEFASHGWRVAPARPSKADPRARPATKDDLTTRRMGLSIDEGDLIAPAGLYASDHDMFAFMINEDRVVGDGHNGLARGFFVANSEVGAASFKVTSFLYDGVCGNHIVWGAKSVSQVSIRHVGNADARAWGELALKVVEYADSSVSDEEAHIQRCIEFELGKDPQEAIERVYKLGILSRKNIEVSYELADHDGRFNPRSAWGMASGITRASQATTFAEQRVAFDQTASRVLDLAFAR